MTVKELLEHSFVITIDDDRYAQFNSIFQYHGLSPLPQRCDGVRSSNGVRGCYLSHRNVLLKAKELGWDYVCIFEDDAYPRMDITGELEHYLSRLPQDCAFLSIGNILMIDFKGLDDDFVSNVQCCGSHAYVVFKPYYDAYIAFLDSISIADCYQRDCSQFIDPIKFISPRKNLFIQYCNDKDAIHHNGGYIINIRTRNPSNELVQKRGFPLIQSIIDKQKC